MTLWWIALALLLVVSVVVAALLYWLHTRAREIERLVGAIWQAGQRVAGNTVHTPQLYRIADGVEAILARASRIAAQARAIEAHAESCPGCPQCIWRR
jgi:Na+/H+-translocating membrane pyrophosphatase